MNTLSNMGAHSGTLPDVRSVPLAQPLNWLGKGWEDLLHHKSASLAYGLLVAVLGALILSIGRHPYLLAAAVTGFLRVYGGRAGGAVDRQGVEDDDLVVALQGDEEIVAEG